MGTSQLLWNTASQWQVSMSPKRQQAAAMAAMQLTTANARPRYFNTSSTSKCPAKVKLSTQFPSGRYGSIFSSRVRSLANRVWKCRSNGNVIVYGSPMPYNRSLVPKRTWRCVMNKTSVYGYVAISPNTGIYFASIINRSNSRLLPGMSDTSSIENNNLIKVEDDLVKIGALKQQFIKRKNVSWI